MRSKAPSDRWTREHGYGHRGRGKRRDRTVRKRAYAAESTARDEALLLDLKFGEAYQAYPCRWGNDYRDGETAPLHWHIGRPKTGKLDP